MQKTRRKDRDGRFVVVLSLHSGIPTVLKLTSRSCTVLSCFVRSQCRSFSQTTFVSDGLPSLESAAEASQQHPTRASAAFRRSRTAMLVFHFIVLLATKVMSLTPFNTDNDNRGRRCQGCLCVYTIE